jgi:hypothetical protein
LGGDESRSQFEFEQRTSFLPALRKEELNVLVRLDKSFESLHRGPPRRSRKPKAWAARPTLVPGAVGSGERLAFEIRFPASESGNVLGILDCDFFAEEAFDGAAIAQVD